MTQAQLERKNQAFIQMDAIYAPVQDTLVSVKESLRQIVPPETELLTQSIVYSMQAPGKLMRPVLLLLASGASGTIGQPHIETAAVAELIHVATLLHDDVLDEANLRRGRSTVSALWGNRVSILSGDYLLAQASLKLSQLDNCRLVSIFAKVLSNLCEGEVEQIRSSYNLTATWDSYFRKSVCKTATLFAACCESAGVLNRLSEPEIQSMRMFGEKFGIAFQIIDDLLDYTSSTEQLGKPVLDDLKNGILNAPVLLALEHFAQTPETLQRLEQLIEQLFSDETDTATQEGVSAQILQLFSQAQVVEKTQALVDRFIQEAYESIQFLPDNVYRQALLDLTVYVTQRER